MGAYARHEFVTADKAMAYPASDTVGSASEVGPAFEERLPARIWRAALSLAYAMRPRRLFVLPAAILLTAEFLISKKRAERRLRTANPRTRQGLVGVSDDLSPAALLDAYRRGVYPMTHSGPMKWWCPAERAVLHPNESRIEKNLRRLIRQGKFRVTFDADFAAVMRGCGGPRSGRAPLTWITPKIMKAYWRLHQAGYAHSVEVWDAEGQLIGGLYGLAIGRVFFGESQFGIVRDASKIAVATLHCHLAQWNFALRDAKNPTEHLASLGFRTISRGEFLDLLQQHAAAPGRVGRWAVDPDLDVATWQPRT